MKVKNYYDTFNYLFFGIYFIVCLSLLTIVFVLRVNALYVVMGLALLVIIILMMIFFYVRTYYLTKDYITIRAGFINKNIYYKDIQKCYIIKNINPFYSSSIKRIAITLKNGKEIYLSPIKMDNTLLKIIRKVEKWLIT